MSNSPQLLQALNRQCSHDHKHLHLMSGRAAAAAFYPLPLLKAILKGMNATREAVQCVQALVEDEWDVVLSMSAKEVAQDEQQQAETSEIKQSSIPLEGGGTYRIEYKAENFKPRYLDEYTREELPLHLVKAATIVQLD